MNNNKLNDSGLVPCSWGSAGWHFLHSIGMAYPLKVSYGQDDDKIKNNMYQFFESLGEVLPCQECRQNYKRNFNSTNLMNSLGSRKELSKWVYDLHNRVNKGTGVPESKWPTFSEVYQKYDNLRASCDTLPGVCSGNGSEMQCKVELRPKNIETFSLNDMSSRETTFITVISILTVLLVLSLVYSYYCSSSGSKKKSKPTRSYGYGKRHCY